MTPTIHKARDEVLKPFSHGSYTVDAQHAFVVIFSNRPSYEELPNILTKISQLKGWKLSSARIKGLMRYYRHHEEVRIFRSSKLKWLYKQHDYFTIAKLPHGKISVIHSENNWEITKKLSDVFSDGFA